MCLMALALGQSERFPLVLASNRDEFHARPTAALDWWPVDGSTLVLGGRDLSQGGSWLALGANGRLALLTNLRRPGPAAAAATSRGHLVSRWLADDGDAPGWWAALDAGAYSPFNIVVADLQRGHWHAAGSADERLQRLAPGVHGLSNAPLGARWPKVLRLENALREALAAHSAHALAKRLFEALADDEPAAGHLLPDTGLAPAHERALSSVFIRMTERGYGTRCSTLLIGERDRGAGLRLQMIERRFDAQGRALPLLRRVAELPWRAGGAAGPRPVEEIDFAAWSAA